MNPKAEKIAIAEAEKIDKVQTADLESSSNRKELLTALFESSVINTLMLEITCMRHAYAKLLWSNEGFHFFIHAFK